jgi:hypothetical protein
MEQVLPRRLVAGLLLVTTEGVTFSRLDRNLGM